MIANLKRIFIEQKSFFSPAIDFFLIGGVSLILLPIFLFLSINKNLSDEIILYAWGLQFLINFPHFSFSYQILYTNIKKNLGSYSHKKILKVKMWNVIFITPMILISCLTYGFIESDIKFLGYMLNAMFFFVGWHYVKQGFGMLIVISALNKFYFTKSQRKFTLFKTYVIWVFTWLLSNFAMENEELNGIPFSAINIPYQKPILITLSSTILICIVLTIQYFLNLKKNKKPFPPINAITGYFSAVYLWVLVAPFLGKLFFAFVPALHSLQYILFVLKYKSAETRGVKTKADLKEDKKIFNPTNIFILLGIFLGAAGFFFAPYYLDENIKFNITILGPSFFLFAFSVFINIHHYFIDNMIWRKENKHIHQYLLTD